MTPDTSAKPNKYAVDRLARETGRARELCEVAYTQAGGLYEPAKALLLKESVVIAPALPPERKRTPTPPKPTPAEEERPKYTPPASPFPHPLPPVKVQLPGDGSPEAIKEYFARTYGKPRQNSTADRARKLCAKLAATSAEVTPAPYDWQAEQAAWQAIRIEEDTQRELTEAIRG